MENLKEICEKASQLYANKNYAEAVSLWKNAAEQGSSDALYMLGICYNYKLGVNEDDSEKCGEIASDYFIKAANLGHADAQCFAGLCYLHGIGVEKDTKQAVKWFEKSAEQNCTQAMNNLGLLYKQGKYCNKQSEGTDDNEDDDCDIIDNYKLSFEWFKKSADLNDATGQLYLGLAYYDGLGVEPDQKIAVKYYSMAADQGSAEAMLQLGECYEDGCGIESNKIEAFKLYKAAAKKNHSKAQCYVGYCYENGIGVPMDMQEALKWYQISAQNNYFQAYCNLGCCFEEGKIGRAHV